MIIFLYGPDDYRREQRKKYYIKEFEKKYSGLSIGRFDLGNSEAPEELKSFARGQSVFEAKNLAIVENLYEADEKIIAKALTQIVVKNGSTRLTTGTTTLLFSEKSGPNKALQFLLEKPARVEEFPHLAGYEWEKFIQQEAKRLGLALSPDAAKFLGDIYQNNSWALITELQKLSALKPTKTRQDSPQVGKKDLDALDLEVAPNYWALMNGVKSGELRNRLWALEKLLTTNDPPPKIFNILASQWREKIPQMAEYDLKIKSGKLDYEEALLELVL